MTNIAASTRELRARLQASSLSMRALARQAGVSDKTIRLFLDGGPCKANTIEAIELAFANLKAGQDRRDSASVVHV